MEDWAVDLGRGLGRQLLVHPVHPRINNQCLAQARPVKKLKFHFTDSLTFSSHIKKQIVRASLRV
jgi:hypothetical protein